jgi:hypothetical protein
MQKQRDFTEEEKTVIAEGAAEIGLSAEDVITVWGGSTIDFYLNKETYWSNVPEAVWEYTIGGLSGIEEMAELPGRASAGARHHEGRSAGVHADDPTSRGADIAAGTRQRLFGR